MKKIIIVGSLAIALGVILFAGCAKPPTEKVAALQDQISKLEGQGAQVFATPQYEQVSAGMSDLNSLMDQKKNKAATAKADSMDALVKALDEAVIAQAPQVAKQAADAAGAEIAKLKAQMKTPEAKKVIVKDEIKKMDEMAAGFDKDLAAVTADIGNSAFLNAYNNANTLKGKIAAAEQGITQKIEEAKAKKGAKAPAKAAPKK
ncbi:MAG: hypothetical protein Q8O92_10170 [Candidatus Latescibacter sp.]|nr:hypothetical protein [Candidatus Latescibacter sp.]